MTPLRLGLLGLGTVAQGVLSILKTSGPLMRDRCGRELVVTRVASRRLRDNVDLGGAEFSPDLASVVAADDVDVVVECVGGEQPCLDLLTEALRNGKSVVTANKALIATHGDLLHVLAAERGVTLSYEAAVAGGIPVLGALTQGLAANRIDWIAGIINGTSNYILTAMAQRGQDFETALRDAQDLGYAEADPTFDIEGVDAAHKLAILAGLGFGRAFRFDAVTCTGISSVTGADIAFADRLGYVIKHLGIARSPTDAGAIELCVHPALVPKSAPLAQVNGVTNAVMVGGDAVGSTVYIGPGAGKLPTASAVLADVVAIARGQAAPRRLAAEGEVSSATSPSPHYLRLQVKDQTGVFARITAALSTVGVGIEAALQDAHKTTTPGEAGVPIVFLTQPVATVALETAIEAIAQQDDAVLATSLLRVEALD
ncbi:MAG: homoserine dehydrogenase [Pseudomonadota bacterium]